MNLREVFFAVCVALTPARSRMIRKEQWSADLRDAPEMGISPTSLLFGAACSSVAARFHDTVHCGGILLSRSIKGGNMKATFGIIGAAVAIAGGIVVGVQANASPAPDTFYSKPAAEDMIITGYEGWWNATPAEGSADHLPEETVAISTRTNQVVDVFNRAMNDVHQVATTDDIDFQVIPDPAWPKDSVVIVETASGKVLESFPTNDKGHVLR